MLTPRMHPGEFVTSRILRHAPSCFILVTRRASDAGECPALMRLGQARCSILRGSCPHMADSQLRWGTDGPFLRHRTDRSRKVAI